MERSEQVGTILELRFKRNNIFTAFPVIPKTCFRSHYLPTKTVRKSLIFKELQKCFCISAKPFHQWRDQNRMEQFWSFGSREIIFSLLSPSSQKPVSRHHYLSTETVRKSLIFKELQKCFCFHAKPYHQWRDPNRLEQFWSCGSREIIFSLLSP